MPTVFWIPCAIHAVATIVVGGIAFLFFIVKFFGLEEYISYDNTFPEEDEIEKEINSLIEETEKQEDRPIITV